MAAKHEVRVPEGVPVYYETCMDITKHGGVEMWDVDMTERDLRLEFQGTKNGHIQLVVRESPKAENPSIENGTVVPHVDGVFQMTQAQFGTAVMMSVHPERLLMVLKEVANAMLEGVGARELTCRAIAMFTGMRTVGVEVILNDAKSRTS